MKPEFTAPVWSSESVAPPGIMHLRRFLEKTRLDRAGLLDPGLRAREFDLDVRLLDALGLSLEATLSFLYQELPGPAEFVAYARAHGATVTGERIRRFNESLRGRGRPDESRPAAVLGPEDFEHWRQEGYLVIRGAISSEQCANARQAILDFTCADATRPESWYRTQSYPQGIMIPLYDHPAQESIRNAPRVRGAYADLWRTDDLTTSTDRAGFLPPDCASWTFQGPPLHWDLDLNAPIDFGVQGLVYLNDVPADGGAFHCVPGFHQRLQHWLEEVPPEFDPATFARRTLESTPVPGSAGDLVIWHHALPHGPSRNLGDRPRFVQYVKCYPNFAC